MTTALFTEKNRPAVFGSCRVTDVVAPVGNRIAAVRVEEVFTAEVAQALERYVTEHLLYERDEIGREKWVSRASRAGEAPDSALLHNDRGAPHPSAAAAFAALAGSWLLGQLGGWLGTPLRVLRPTTPYRLDVGDYIKPHDDRGAPEYRLSIAYNLTRHWSPGDGGATVVGLVDRVEEYEHPDFFFPLKRWTLKPDDQTVLTPVYNSALLLVLDDDFAHAVEPVRRTPRFSLTTLYGDRVTRR